jgi:predicted nucleic acid-binding protein
MKAEPARYVLDSFALLAHLQGEPAGRRVKAILAQAEKRRAVVVLSIINYGEAVYIIEREHGMKAAQTMIAAVDQLPVTVVAADRRLTFSAAHIKALHPISYADAFTVALAVQEQATVVTGDPEFRRVEHLAPVEWLNRQHRTAGLQRGPRKTSG